MFASHAEFTGVGKFCFYKWVQVGTLSGLVAHVLSYSW